MGLYDNLPKIKRKISSYLTSEQGKISKDSILNVGTLVAGLAMVALGAKPVKACDGADEHVTWPTGIPCPAFGGLDACTCADGNSGCPWGHTFPWHTNTLGLGNYEQTTETVEATHEHVINPGHCNY